VNYGLSMSNKRGRASAGQKSKKKVQQKGVPIKKRGRSISFLKKVPTGIKVVIYYTFVLAFFYTFYFLVALVNPAAVFMGMLVKGAAAIMIELIIVSVIFLVIYGLVKREYWAWKLSIAWFIFGIINALASIIASQYEAFLVIRELIAFSSIIIIFVNSFILWYLISKKRYFKFRSSKEEFGITDKIFVYTFACFWIISVLVLLALGIQFYKSNIDLADEILVEIRGKSVDEAIIHCKEQPVERKDMCFVVVAVAQGSDDILDTYRVCKNVESDFYKYTCYKASE